MTCHQKALNAAAMALATELPSPTSVSNAQAIIEARCEIIVAAWLREMSGMGSIDARALLHAHFPERMRHRAS